MSHAKPVEVVEEMTQLPRTYIRSEQSYPSSFFFKNFHIFAQKDGLMTPLFYKFIFCKDSKNLPKERYLQVNNAIPYENLPLSGTKSNI